MALALALVIVFLVLLILALGIWIGILLWQKRHPPPPPPCPEPPRQVPDQIDEPGLSAMLGIQLIGTPADGSAPSPGAAPPAKVIWVDAGDEVLVHLDSARTRILDGTLLVSIDLETDQTGRTPLVMAFALGTTGDPAGLVATTDDLPRGHGGLAARWGKAVQAAVWASLLQLARTHAGERGKAPLGITAVAGQLSFHAGEPLRAAIPGGRP